MASRRCLDDDRWADDGVSILEERALALALPETPPPAVVPNVQEDDDPAVLAVLPVV